MKFLRCMALTAAAALAFTTGAAARTVRVDERFKETREVQTSKNDLFFDDFSSGGTDVGAYGYNLTTQGDSTITIETVEDGSGKKQQVLSAVDALGGEDYGGLRIAKAIPEITAGSVGFEIRFMMKKRNHTHAGMGIYLANGNTMATRFGVWGSADGKMFYNNGSASANLTDGMIAADTWYTLRATANMDTRKVDMLLTTDDGSVNAYYAEYEFHSDFNGKNSINNFIFESRQYDAQWCFEYIRVTRDLKIEKPPKKRPSQYIDPPISAAPGVHAVPGINVTRDGEPFYFSYAPVYEAGNVFVTARSAFRVFGMNLSIDGMTYTGTSGDSRVVIQTDTRKMTVNGAACAAESCIDKDGQLYVSLNAIAEGLGFTAQYNDEASILSIQSAKEAAE